MRNKRIFVFIFLFLGFFSSKNLYANPILVPAEVLFIKSQDKGLTWPDTFFWVGGQEVLDYPPPLCNYGDTLYTVWAEKWFSKGYIILGFSPNQGDTWFPGLYYERIRVDDDFPSFKRNPWLAVGPNGNLFCVWEDARNDSSDIYFAKSVDGGNSWTSPNIKVNDNFPGIQAHPSIVSNSGNLYVVWQDNRDGNYNIYFAKSIDTGSTWTDPNIKVNPSLGGDQIEPCLKNGNGTTDSFLFVVWRNIKGDTQKIYFSKSEDGGETWIYPIKINDVDTFEKKNPSIDVKDSFIVIAWEDSRDGESHIYFNKSEDGGLTWLDSNIRVDDGSSGRKVHPAIAIDDSNYIYAVWEDYRNNDTIPQIFFARSIDGGLTWTEPNVLIGDGYAYPGSGGTMGDNKNGFPCIKVVGNNVYVIWQIIGEWVYGIEEKSRRKEAIYLEYSSSENSVIISYGIPYSGNVKLSLYNLSGRLCKNFYKGKQEKGHYVFTWNKVDNRGKKIKKGLYFLRLKVDNSMITKKIFIF